MCLHINKMAYKSVPQWYVNLKKNVKQHLRATVIYCSLPGVICDFALSTVTFELSHR